MLYNLEASWPVMKDTEINVINCIQYFDAHKNQIYIVNEQNQFNGLILTKESFKNIWREGEQWAVFLPDYIKRDSLDSLAEDKKTKEELDVMFQQFAVTEIPAVVNNQIACVITYSDQNNNNTPELDWDKIDLTSICGNYVQYEKVCISSLNDKNLLQL